MFQVFGTYLCGCVTPQHFPNLTKPIDAWKAIFFVKFVPVLTTLCMLRFKFLELVCAGFFLPFLKSFVRSALRGNVSVTIFFGTVDWHVTCY